MSKWDGTVVTRQDGTAAVSLVAVGAATTVVTFTRPFTTTPRVSATVSNSTGYIAYVSAKSSTQMTVGVRHYDNTSATTTINVDWEAWEP